jgi:PAS domain S-box-containing protein/TyrR family helix-turn-helix protein
MDKTNAAAEQPTDGAVNEIWRHGSDGVMVVDPAFERVQMNPRAEALSQGLPRSTMPPGLEFILFLRKRGVFNQVPSVDNEVLYAERWFLVTVARAAAGAHVVFMREISAVKDLETRLRALEAANDELNEIIELSADGLVSLDHNGVILRMNKAYEEIVGIRAEDFLGKPARLIQQSGHLPDLVSNYVLKDLKPRNIFVKLKGREVLLTGRPVFNDQGALIRVVANIRDMTELNHLRTSLENFHELTHRYETEIQRLRAREFETEIIGHSPAINRSLELAIQASTVDSTALIFGETGTGKELFAKTIHRLSRRASGPFIAINCSALPEALLESELFGYDPGAFTGAQRDGKIGLLEAAQKGTVFLDEISEVPLSIQVKLLRFIQEKTLRRLGSHKEKEIDTRIIAASNQDLKEHIRHGRFREDLYYRLNVINIAIPPLRERREDIPLLAAHFLEVFNKKFGRQKQLTPQMLSMLVAHAWPGNVRELENIMERFTVLSEEMCLEGGAVGADFTVDRRRAPEAAGLRDQVAATEREILLNAYRECGSTRKTAQKLGISQATIVRKLKKYAIEAAPASSGTLL